MKSIKKLSVVSIVILFSLIASLVFPISVLADDATPPAEATSEVLPPTQEPVTTEEPVVTAAPVATDAPVIVEASPTVPASTDASTTDDASPTDGASDVNLTEIVAQLDTADLVLLDENGQSVPLASNEAAQALTAPDPIGCPPGVKPIAWGGTGVGCTSSYTSIQAAINDPLVVSGWTVYIEAGTYNEQITIQSTKANLTLYGDPGNLTLAGVGPNAPILDGSLWASGDIGITVFAEGFTLRGLIIQNFDIALLQQTISGNNTITYDNNVFQDNKDGIKVVKDGGSPGIQMHYNVFQNNSGYDLINVDPNGHNIQDINAMNNYWGCPEGPVVAFSNLGEEDYILWADRNGHGGQIDPYVHENNDWPNCALLYGDATLFE